MANRSVVYTNTLQEFFETYNLTAADVGDISAIDTTATNLVAAVNEVHGERDALDTRVGALSSIHADIREADVTQSVDAFYDDYIAWAAPATAFDTTAQTATGALNELHGQYDGLSTWVGTRTLTFTGGVISASTVQAGIQNVWSDYYSFVGRGTAFTTSATTVLGAINELETNHNSLDTRVGALATINDAIEGASVVVSINNLYTAYSGLNTWVGTRTLTFTGGIISATTVQAGIQNIWSDYYNFVGRGIAFTTSASTVLGAINELESNHNSLDTRVGALATLADDIEGASVVVSINNVDSKYNTRVGALTSIHADIRGASVAQSLDTFYDDYLAWAAPATDFDTTAQTATGAVNELHGEINSNAAAINSIRSAITGNSGSVSLTGLNDAIEGANLVATFNTFYSAYATRTDVGTTLRTTAQTLGAAINEIHGAFVSPGNPTEGEKDTATLDGLHYRVGNLSNLAAGIAGANDDNIVSAINYIYELQTGESVEFTNANVTGTLDVGGAATFSTTLTVEGAFTSLGIDDNATANRITIENSSIALKTATSVTGALSASSTVTGTAFITGVNGSITNNSGEGIEFDNTANDVTIVAGAQSIAEFDTGGVDINYILRANAGIAVTGTLTVGGNTVWHSGNDGTTSGLDADLLDGIQAASFARKDQAETFASNVTIQGNLTVNGTTTTINTTNLVVSDNIIVLNNDVTGTPTENAGIEVERGTSANVSIRWNETSDIWELTQNGSNFYRMLTVADEGAGNGLDADTLDGQHGSYYLAWSNLTGVPATFTPSAHTHATTDIVSGTFADARIAQSNVTQHQAALALAASQITSGTFANARIAQGNVTQHQAALALAGTQITTGTIADARLPSTMAGKTFSSSVIVTGNVTAVDIYANRGDGTGVIYFGDATKYLYYNGSSYILNGAELVVNGGTAWHSGNDGPASGLNADLLDGQHADAFAAASHTHATSDITSGTFADARIAQSNVTQHQAALVLGTSQITSGTFADARIAQSNVTQHQAALALAASQITSGTFDLARIPTITLTKLDAAAIQTSGESFSYSDSILMTAAAIDQRIQSYGYTTNVGDITGVTAGTGLSGGGTSGSVTLNVTLSGLSTSNLIEGSRLYYTDERANAAIDARVTKAFVDALSIAAASAGTASYASNAGDADTLDALQSTQFLRSDAATTKTSGNLVFNDNIRATFGSSSDTTIYHDGVQSFITHGTGGFHMDMAGDANDVFIRNAGITKFTFDVSSGNFTATGDVTAYSDLNLKTEIVPVLGGLEIIDQIVPVYYRWNREGQKRGMINRTHREIGVIAQDVERVLPEAVHENDVGDKLVAYEKLIPVLMDAIKELKQRVETLEAK